MNVWIITHTIKGELCEIKGVFSSSEEADDYMDYLLFVWGKEGFYSIKKMKVDERKGI